MTKQQKREQQKIRYKHWWDNRTEEEKAEIRKKKAQKALEVYHSNPEIKERQKRNFKKSYKENPNFRAKIIFSASTGRYKMTPTQYDEKLKKQKGHCALCKSTDGDAGRRLHIDHDHGCCDVGSTVRTCGKCNRGILCGKCNRKLGALEAVLKEATVVPKKGTWTARALAYILHYEGLRKQTQ